MTLRTDNPVKTLSSNHTPFSALEPDPRRRICLQGGLSAWISTLLPGLSACSSWQESSSPNTRALPLKPYLGFSSVPLSTQDEVIVPPGYTAQVLAPWGEPVGVAHNMPPFHPEARNTAEEQALQMGMHHDGMHYFPLPGAGPNHGLLVMNHEYVDDRLLHTDGRANWRLEKVRKSQAAHGVSVIEVQQNAQGIWDWIRPSPYARRITALTPMQLSGPAAGHRLLQTAMDPSGQRVLGTLNNCGAGITPWGTYLTCEENFIDYFKGPPQPDAHQTRWGLRTSSSVYRWHEWDERFDAQRHPHEPHRFGWVVEIDPLDPHSMPIKRTALGRAAHEGATVGVTASGHAVVYMGEDARFEYITKFVSRDPIRPGGAAANRDLLDHGTLYVARFNADGTGDWLPLVQGQGPLTADQGFAEQADVLIHTRSASDRLGATRMDRPEWTAIDPHTREVYVSLSNNSARGQTGHPGPDAANPRPRNITGHIIRWKDHHDLDGLRFAWAHFVLAEPPGSHPVQSPTPAPVHQDAFACPDGLWIGPQGLLWIQTDMSSSLMGQGELAHMGHNMMLAAHPRTGEIRRFLTGPRGCEITGVTSTPDGRTMFVNIQHPGESPSSQAPSSRWPHTGDRPRSATVAIRRQDGGVVGQ